MWPIFWADIHLSYLAVTKRGIIMSPFGNTFYEKQQAMHRPPGNNRCFTNLKIEKNL